MRWSWQVATMFGIPVRIHWSMALLLLFVSWSGGIVGVMASLVALGLLFASVVAHELAHALAARGFGIGTSEILLLPIGGVAKIAAQPRSGRQEVAIALAGPAMSLAIAGTAALVALLGPAGGVLTSVATLVAGANLMLGLFNLLPAFPLDGGRVLRGALHERRGLVRATQLAATVGRVVAVPMALAGLVLGSISLVLIAGFVWLSGRAEQKLVEATAAWQGGWRGADGWVSPAERWGQRSAAPAPTSSGQGWGWAQPRATGRRFVIQPGPFGYVIREL